MKVIKKILYFLLLFVIFLAYFYVFAFNIYNTMHDKSLNINYTAYIQNNDVLEKMKSETLISLVNNIISRSIKDIVYNENTMDEAYISSLLDQNMDKIIEEFGIDNISNTLDQFSEENINDLIKEYGIDNVEDIDKILEEYKLSEQVDKQAIINNFKQEIKNTFQKELISIKDNIKKSVSIPIFGIMSKIFSKKIFSIVSITIILLIVATILLSEKLKGIIANGIIAILSSVLFIALTFFAKNFIIGKMDSNLSFIKNILNTIYEESFSYCKQFIIFGIILILLYITVYIIKKREES